MNSFFTNKLNYHQLTLIYVNSEGYNFFDRSVNSGYTFLEYMREHGKLSEQKLEQLVRTKKFTENLRKYEFESRKGINSFQDFLIEQLTLLFPQNFQDVEEFSQYLTKSYHYKRKDLEGYAFSQNSLQAFINEATPLPAAKQKYDEELKEIFFTVPTEGEKKENDDFIYAYSAFLRDEIMTKRFKIIDLYNKLQKDLMKDLKKYITFITTQIIHGKLEVGLEYTTYYLQKVSGYDKGGYSRIGLRDTTIVEIDSHLSQNTTQEVPIDLSYFREENSHYGYHGNDEPLQEILKGKTRKIIEEYDNKLVDSLSVADNKLLNKSLFALTENIRFHLLKDEHPQYKYPIQVSSDYVSLSELFKSMISTENKQKSKEISALIISHNTYNKLSLVHCINFLQDFYNKNLEDYTFSKDEQNFLLQNNNKGFVYSIIIHLCGYTFSKPYRPKN